MAKEIPRKWALVWWGPSDTIEINKLFPHMGERYPIAHGMIVAEAGESVDLVNPFGDRELSTEHILEQVHDASYIEQVDERDECPGVWEGGNPALAWQAGFSFHGTAVAAMLIANGTYDFAYSLASGQHHAKRDRGAGFCVFNDVAGAALAFVEHGLRPLVIDIDIHAGDGTQEILWDSGVPTLSIHVGSIFPADSMLRDESRVGQRHTFHWPDNDAYNFVLEDRAVDESLEWALNEADPIIRRYAPDVIVFVVGSDGHDGTTEAGVDTAYATYSYRGFDRTARRVREWADEFCSGRILMTSAGGYQPLNHTPRIWANTAMRLAGVL